MDNTFQNTEKLYRAVYPPEVADIFWKKDGSISSAAFADPKGLSVERGDYRKDNDVISSMRKKFSGHIISLYVKNCTDTGAVVIYTPSRTNIYHSEIHGNEKTALLSKSQRRYLANHAVILTPRPL
ncbi:MAG: hypothetical protein IKN45_00285 [Lachnospiraceae bacterium]|nr:hypothetical protein [Lachnospiraceae bacterium]MBR3636332.1 hypothetical protein [Lachnospiraceae bacterium]